MKQAILLLSSLLIFSSTAFAVPAFPGAVGVGMNTVGGRGGQVIHVTNLNDSGAGSLRAALLSSGPRIVVFDVSGNINLTSILTVKNPYLTIAGQTSPGGVAISGKQFNVATHDVIIRHMRFRSGGHEYTGNDSDGDSFDLWGPNWGGNMVYNIIIDHCSFTWGTDETFSITGGATATTVQNSLIAEGLNYAKSSTSKHSKGLMISGKYNYDTEVSLYKNYIAHVEDRAPLLYNPAASSHQTVPTYIVEGTNNVSYNWKGGSRPGSGGDAPVNWTNNYAKEGPNSNRQNYIFEYANQLSTTKPLIYLKGNIGTGRSASDPEWRVSVDWHDTPLSSAWQKDTPWPIAVPLPSETMTYTLAQEIVLDSGATAPVRDSVDERIVKSFAAGTGSIPDTVSYPGDWPTYATPKAPTDSDGDGMPDAWESSKGTNPSLDDSKGHTLDSGYTNIEVYINELAGGNYDVVQTPEITPPVINSIVTQ